MRAGIYLRHGFTARASQLARRCSLNLGSRRGPTSYGATSCTDRSTLFCSTKYDQIRWRTLGVECCLDGKSDHRAAFARFRLRDYERGANSRRRVQAGWKPKLDEEKKPTEYHECLNAALQHSQTDLAAAVVEAATSTAAQRPRPRREHNAEVQALFEQRRDEDDPERRKQLSKQLWKALRRQRR